MAGTPDKSGEHKASGGPAPEDPRLAVSRSVDQETAVFSVRDAGASGEDPDPDPDATPASQDAGDERLRAAVAAWVSGGEGSTEPSAVANPNGDGVADPVSDAAAADADSDAEADVQGSGALAATADAKPDADGDADGDGKSGAESAVTADAHGDGEPAAEGDADGEPAAKAAGEADAPSDGKPVAKGDVPSDGKPAAEAGGEAGAESAVEADAHGDGEPAAEGDAKADVQPTAKGDAVGGGEPAVKADAKSGAEVDAQVTAEGDADAEPAAESVVGADAPSDGKPAAEGGCKADVQATAKGDAPGDGKPAVKADAKSGAQADAQATVEGDADGEPAATADGVSAAEGGGKADVQPTAKGDAPGDGKPAAKADGKSGAKSGAKADVQPGAKAGANADSRPGAKAGAQPGASAGGTSGASAGGTSGASAGGKSDASAGGTSGGNAGGTSGGKGDGESDAVAGRGVDQGTAVFKAVSRPVDQPTTTLKAAGTAKSSKFVPLKGLDEGATGKELPPEAEPTVEPAERTTQQPLPPKPPLDLLAELTNTPPPAETRVRTAVRRVKVWTPLVILLVIVFGVIQAVRPLPTPSLSLTTDATYSFDGEKASLPWPGEGQGWMDVQGIGTMDNFGKQTPVPIGSVAKSMTAYIVLKDHPLKAGADGASITVDATAEKEGGYDADGQNESTLNTVKEGDKISQKDALAAVMIPSANNIARLLARWDAGSEEAFVKKMNATAKKLGMKNTTYTDPSGLKETTVSTAQDQVKLGNELVQIPALTDITKLPTWTDPSGKKWTNYNRLVPYDGAIGIKTGTTTKAGGNLLFAATKDAGGSTVTVVGAILGQHRAPIIDTVNAVSKTAMLAAQDAVTSSTVLKKGDVVGYVDDQLGGRTPVTVTKDVKAVGWAGKTVHLQLAEEDGTSVPHTGKAGDTVGVLEVGDGEGGAVEVPVALQKSLTEPGFGAKLTRVG